MLNASFNVQSRGNFNSRVGILRPVLQSNAICNPLIITSNAQEMALADGAKSASELIQQRQRFGQEHSVEHPSENQDSHIMGIVVALVIQGVIWLAIGIGLGCWLCP